MVFTLQTACVSITRLHTAAMAFALLSPLQLWHSRQTVLVAADLYAELKDFLHV